MSDIKQADLKQEFINGMSHAAATVNIVTTDGAAGRAGVTVSAMSSVSADTPKPTLLVCVHHQSPAANCILDNGVFCVNVLRSDQSYISDTFAGRFKDQTGDKFDCASWTTQVTGSPRVVDPLVSFDCKVLSSEQVGTHYVFFGEVEDVFIAEAGSPLVYANRSYGATTRIEQSDSAQQGLDDADRTLRVGCVHTFGPYFLPSLIARLKKQNSGIKIQLVEGSQRRVKESLVAGEVDIAFLYDLELPGEIQKETVGALKPYVLLADNHDLCAKEVITADDLQGHPMVLLDVPPSGDYFRQMLIGEGIEPDVQYRSSSFEMVRGLVGHGLGYTILATKPASAMTYDGFALETRPLSAQVDSSEVVMVTRSGASVAPAAKEFATFSKQFFKL